MAMKKKSGKKKGITVNFSGVETGGRRCPDGEYQAEIIEASLEESSNGNPMIKAKIKITEGKYQGVTMFDNISLLPQALFKLKSILVAVGAEAQEEDVSVEDYIPEITEKTITIVVANETYEGTQRPKVVAYAGAEEGGEEESDEEEEADEPRVANKGKGKAKPAKEEEEDDEDEEEDSDEEDDAEEDEEDDDEEEETKPAKKASKGNRVKEGSRVKFDDGDGNIVKGTVTSLDDGKATVEDKAGDEYEVDAEDLTLL